MHASSSVRQIQVLSPEARVTWIKNAIFEGRRISLTGQVSRPFDLPTMYLSWTDPQVAHLSFVHKEDAPEFVQIPQKDLMIFDTWGTSSYYHLLIDHIIPLWITREWFRTEFGILNDDVEYLRISRNGYPTELSQAQDIFSYFIGRNFLEDAHSAFSNITYGYFFSYRPYLGPAQNICVWPNYKVWLEKFRLEFCQFDRHAEKYILVPLRETRNFDFVGNFVERYKSEVNFKIVDFGKLSIEEQIIVAGSAKAIFGAEGAAFANMVFMHKSASVIPVAAESDRFLFHSTLANYTGQKFIPIQLDERGAPSLSERLILSHLKQL